MRKIYTFLAVAVMLFFTALASAQEPVTLKVTRGNRDIVNISNPTIVGIANLTDNR